MKRLIFILGFVLAVFSINAQTYSYHFYLTVVDSTTLQGIEGAAVTIFYENGMNVDSLSDYTDTSGFVAFDVNDSQSSLSQVEVRAEAEGYSTYAGEIPISNNETNVSATLYMVSSDTTGRGVFEYMWMQDFSNPLKVAFYSLIDSNLPPDVHILFDFGDGSPTHQLGNDSIVHTYAQEGAYAVRMFVENNSQFDFTDSVFVFNFYPDSIDCFADFDYFPTDTTGTNWLEYQFYNYSYGQDLNYQWEFGDGGISSDENPIHSYTEAGDYWVTLIADNETCTDSLTLPLWAGNVNDLWYPDSCQALFYTVYDTANVVQFIDISYAPSQIIERHWDFGDSSEAYTVASPIHQYADTGAYTVTYEIQDENGYYSEYTQDVYITGQPDSCLLFFPDSLNTGKSVGVKFHNLTGDDGSDWVWNFGDSKAYYKGSKGYVTHTYQNPGQYHVTAINSKGNGYAQDIEVGNDGTVLLLKGYAIKGNNASAISSVNTENVKVYPNPATEVLNIRISNNNSNVTIYAANGQKVLDKNYDAGIAKINVSYLPTGVYTVRISNNGKVYTGKFVK